MEPTIVLIPSPLLGPSMWESTGRVLEQLGRRVRVPSLVSVATSAPPYWPAGVEAVKRTAGDGAVVLVPHSNSGLYVPALLDALGDQVHGVVFVDAALPGTGYLAQRGFLDALAGEDGLLPPWTSWWEQSDVDDLFPNDQVRAHVEAEQACIPLAYYDYPLPDPSGWDRSPCAYLWFGEPYDIIAEQVGAQGWPVRHVPGNHLHMLFDPETVAAAILELAGCPAELQQPSS